MNEEILNFRVIRKIGSGSFGEVFLAEDKYNGSQVAVKKELKNAQITLLPFESKMLKSLDGCVGIPRFRWSGDFGNYNVLIMQLLGPSIEQLFEYCNRKLTVKTILMVGIQLIQIIKTIHSKHIIHRDLKPDNMLFGLGKNRNSIFLIDFGLGKVYRDSRKHVHIPFRTGIPFQGTVRYCSINAHDNFEQSRRDDLESIAYILIYLLRGSLPWQNIKASKLDKSRLIGEKKKSITEEELCRNMPDEFGVFLKAVKSLKFDETPNYDGYLSLFRNLFSKKKYQFDYDYDWDIINRRQQQS